MSYGTTDESNQAYSNVTEQKWVEAATPLKPDPVVARSSQQIVQPTAIKPRAVTIVSQSPKGLDSNGNANQTTFTLTVGAGNSLYQAINFTDTATTGFTMTRMAYTVYIDTVDFADAWPFGTNIDVTKHNIQAWESSNKFISSGGTFYYTPTKPNEASYWLGIKNTDSVSHSYIVFLTIRFVSNSTSSTG